MTRLFKPLQILTFLTISTTLSLGSIKAIAHQVEISKDVGGTVHVEPNDAPRAGEPTLAWFALTQRGGQAIPLSDCDCQLTVYAVSGTGENDGAIATPALTPLSVEGYENVPSATITFPGVGAYELVITGQPSAAATFQPFELRFDVTVATIAPSAPAPTPTTLSEAAPRDSESTPETNGRKFSSGVAIALIPLAILGLGWVIFKSRQPSLPSDDGEP
ncbi:MAG: hypothetical protein IGR76_12495 [Synechococcales cyanobacterium T60_A2020_003]|nr:hypothetical protein [Synechococcales cyanobacterium T60_A2020_003]